MMPLAFEYIKFLYIEIAKAVFNSSGLKVFLSVHFDNKLKFDTHIK